MSKARYANIGLPSPFVSAHAGTLARKHAHARMRMSTHATTRPHTYTHSEEYAKNKTLVKTAKENLRQVLQFSNCELRLMVKFPAKREPHNEHVNKIAHAHTHTHTHTGGTQYTCNLE